MHMRLLTLGTAILLGLMPVIVSAQGYASSSQPSMGSASSPQVAPSSAAGPFPYFRRTGTGSSVSSSVSSAPRPVPTPPAAPTPPAPPPAPAAVLPQIGVYLESDRAESNPGDEVRYWIRVRNMFNEPLPSWQIAFFYDANQMRILEKGGGRMEGNRVTFTVPPLRPNEEWSFTVRTQLFTSLQNGELVMTYASMIWDGKLSPACSKNQLRIFKIERLQTGVELSASEGPAEQFVLPSVSRTEEKQMPFMAWAGVVLTGVGIGGGVGKKLL